MKKSGSKSANMYVMFGLLAVLFVSLGYLSMQGKEGMENKKKAGFKGGREGMTPGDKKKAALGIEGMTPGEKKKG